MIIYRNSAHISREQRRLAVCVLVLRLGGCGSGGIFGTGRKCNLALSYTILSEVFECAVVRIVFDGLLLDRVDGDVAQRASRVRRICAFLLSDYGGNVGELVVVMCQSAIR